MEVKTSVLNCRECPHASNSSKDHDCAFTSTPLNVTWYCKKDSGPVWIKNPKVIDPNCPILKETNNEN